MTLATFLKLVEIQTKLASLFPFLIGVLFTLHRFGQINIANTALFFASMLIFDMATTAINHYMDWKKATSDVYRREHNVIGRENISITTVRLVIGSLLLIATLLGLFLVSSSTTLVLWVGILCFAIGIFYTFGPLPLSRLPLGEVFSGVTMGFGIMFLTVYVNTFELGWTSISFGSTSQYLAITLNLELFLPLIIVAMPSVLTIANVMLANNICDLEEDIMNNRFTLVYFIGKDRAVRLFELLYYATFVMLIAGMAMRFIPLNPIFFLLVFFPVYKHLKLFRQTQVKSYTFVLSVKNLVLINGALLLTFGVHLVLVFIGVTS